MKDNRYITDPTENIVLGEIIEPKSLRTQYQVIIDTKTKIIQTY